MYEESRPGTKGSSSFSRQAMFRAAHSPWAAASFVTGGAVDLARQPQTGQGLGLQRAVQLHRVGIVIFDGIAGTHHDGMLQTGDGVDHGLLHVQRQAGGDAVGIDLRAVQAFGPRKIWCRSRSGKRATLSSMEGQ